MEDQANNNTIRRNTVHDRKQCYRDLLIRLEEIQESNDVGLETIEKTNQILKRIDSLSDECEVKEKVKNPDEIMLDAFVLSSASNLVVKFTKALDVFAANYEPLEFATKVVNTIKTNEDVEQFDFPKLLEDARDIIPNVIEYNFVYGAYDITKPPEPKERKQRVKQVQEKVAKKELIEVKKKTVDEEEENNDNVMFLAKALEEEFKRNKEQPLKYYDFVIDTNSYSATVENMFYFSFLIRDGRASLDVDANNIPIIKPISKKELKNFRHGNGNNTQMITSLDMEAWNRLKSKEGHIQKRRHKQ